MKHANVVFRNEFHFSKRIVFPYSALRKIPVKLLLYSCEGEPSLVNTLYPKFIAVTSSVLPELLIFDKFPSEPILPSKTINIDKIAKELAEAVSNNDHGVVNELLEQLSSVSDRQLLHLWSLSEPFQARGQQKNIFCKILYFLPLF